MQTAEALRKIDVLAPADVKSRAFAPPVSVAPRDHERFVGRALAFGLPAEIVLRAGDDPERAPASELVAERGELPCCGAGIFYGVRRGGARPHAHLRRREIQQTRRDRRLAAAVTGRSQCPRSRRDCSIESPGERLHARKTVQRLRFQLRATAAFRDGDHRLGVRKRTIHVTLGGEALGAQLEQPEPAGGIDVARRQRDRHDIDGRSVLSGPGEIACRRDREHGRISPRQRAHAHGGTLARRGARPPASR